MLWFLTGRDRPFLVWDSPDQLLGKDSYSNTVFLISRHEIIPYYCHNVDYLLNICQHLSNSCTNFSYLSVNHIINMLSIIVEYYFCVRSTHKPVITWSISAPPVHKSKKILIDSHWKTNVRKAWYMSQISKSFEVPSGSLCALTTVSHQTGRLKESLRELQN